MATSPVRRRAGRAGRTRRSWAPTWPASERPAITALTPAIAPLALAAVGAGGWSLDAAFGVDVSGALWGIAAYWLRVCEHADRAMSRSSVPALESRRGGYRSAMSAITAESLDHVALWVSGRDPLTAFLCDCLGMHVIERGDDFTLVGVDAKQGKLTLFDAEGPRERGVLERIVLRVSDLEAATTALPSYVDPIARSGGAEFEVPEGLRLGLVEREGIDYDLDHVVLRTPEAEETADRLAQLGFQRRNGALQVADRHVIVESGGEPEAERPLLNHLALLVDSVERIDAEARSMGFEIEKTVDAENTLAVFVRGPDGILVEFVEHKPGFSLE